MTYFERRERHNGGHFYATTSDAPDWVQEAVRDCHGDMLPNDWVYEKCAHIFSSYEHDYDPTASLDSVFEIADSLVDIYTHQLISWLAEVSDATAEFDEALAEGASRFDEAAMWAQNTMLTRMAAIIRNAIEHNTDN